MDLPGLLLLLATGLLLFVLLVSAITGWMLTHPPRRTYSWAVMRGVPGEPSEVRLAEGAAAFESWEFESRGRSLSVWDIRGRNPDGPVCVFTHGWGDSRVVALSRLPALLACCRRIVMWDLPGHGASPGVCTLGTRECDDLLALIERVVADGHPPVLLYGSSLGAGVSIAVAAAHAGRLGIVGVVAEAPYRVPRVPAERVLALRGLPWRWNVPIAMAGLGLWLGSGLSWLRTQGAGGFDRAEHAARLGVPLLVIHGTDDEVCPIEDGRAIAAAAPAGLGQIAEIEGAAHNNLWTDDRYISVCAAAVAEFVAAARGATPSGDEAAHRSRLPTA